MSQVDSTDKVPESPKQEQMDVKECEVEKQETEPTVGVVKIQSAPETQVEATMEDREPPELEREPPAISDDDTTVKASVTNSETKMQPESIGNTPVVTSVPETKHQSEIDEKREEIRKKEEQHIAVYKTQIKQHAVTICALEERLDKLLKKNKDYQAEVGALKKTVTELSSQPKFEGPPMPKMIIQAPAPDIVELEHVNVQLKTENKGYKEQVQTLQDVVTILRKDLSGTTAQLSDRKHELSEHQKRQYEKNKKLVQDQKKEVAELRQRLSKMAQAVEKRVTEVKDLNRDLTKHKTALTKYKSLAADRDAKIKTLEEELRGEQEQAKKQLNMLQEGDRITSELTSLGAQCRGDRHEQIIVRQREALSELRNKIRNMEQTHSGASGKDSSVYEVVLLKKQLAEMKASQALNDKNDISQSILEHQVNKARGLDPQSQAEAEVERSAHRETTESLELSENSFLELLRSISNVLEMEKIGGLRSMGNITKGERADLFSEREHACEQIKSRIKILKERIARRDERLKDYERDLAKLRQAEQLVEHQKSQIEHLGTEIRNKTEEAEYLRESLNRARQQLDDEKRRAAVIKLKKIPDRDVAAWRKHSCCPDAPKSPNVLKKRETNEKLKRKNFEIRTLKTELANRDKQLDATKKKLDNIQPTLVSVEKLPVS